MKLNRNRSKKLFQTYTYKVNLQNIMILYLTLLSNIFLTLSKSFFSSSPFSNIHVNGYIEDLKMEEIQPLPSYPRAIDLQMNRDFDVVGEPFFQRRLSATGAIRGIFSMLGLGSLKGRPPRTGGKKFGLKVRWELAF